MNRDRDRDSRDRREGGRFERDRDSGRIVGDGRNNNDRDHYRSSGRDNHRRSRSPTRSDSRDRKRARNDNSAFDHYGSASSSNRPLSTVEPSLTVVLKGLPSHTTEPTLYSVLAQFYPKEIRLIMQRDGDCKGYAFVEFPSLEYSQYFMTAYAGSAGDRNAAQLIIENRAVLIEYARGDNDKREPRGDRERVRDRDREGAHGPGTGAAKSDWLCDSCHCHNFARRDSCFRCSSARTEKSVGVASGPSHGEAHSDAASDVPCTYLLVRGLSPMMNEEQVSEVFRQFAFVKHVALVRDPAAHYSRGLAFVEFFTLEHAQYALQCTNGMALNTRDLAVSGDTTLHVTFAKEAIMHAMIRKAQQPGNVLAVNPLVAQALQAAQWSANNGYSTTVPHSQQPPAPPGAPPTAPAQPAMYPTGSTAYVSAPPPPPQYTPAFQLPQHMPLQVPAQEKVVPRWPPHFETNGGQYVYQAASGYFLNAATDFLYDPKSHLYYNGRDGVYFSYDATVQPPFRLFSPPEPREPFASSAPAHQSQESAHSNVGISGTLSSTAAAATTNEKSKPAGGMSAPVKSGAVGFGFGLGAAKKVKIVLAKWGSLQQDEEEEVEVVNGKAGEKQQGVSSKKECDSGVSADKASVLIPTAAPTNISVREADTAASSSSSSSGSGGSPPVPTAVVLAVHPAAPASVLAAVSVTAAPAVSVVPPLAPVCLLCQRQFASFEMLARHEKESKLHADNLKKLHQ